MLSQPTPSAVVFAAFCWFALDTPAGAQAPPAAPAPVVSIGTMNKLFNEAEAGFAAKDYATAVMKIQELLTALGSNKDAPLELLYFNIGLGNLLGDKFAAAEAGFADCLKRFPQGEYASRCHLGVGRACILQNTPEKKQQSIAALKLAAKDPKYRSEAGLWLGKVLNELGKNDEALAVFRSLMGSDVRTPQQTTAAVEVIGLLAETGKLEDLSAYLDRVTHQAGVRDALAWYANQVIVRGDELVVAEAYDAALIIYRSVPPRSQILEIQAGALETMRKDCKILENTVAMEKNKPLNKISNASALLNALKPAIELAETATKAIEEKTDLDAALLMRRGRCLYYLERYEEALVCFRILRTKFADTPDAQHAAYAEIVIYNKLKNTTEIKEKCELFLRKYPDAENLEQIATLAGEVLVQSKNWKEISSFYRDLETKFPKSENLDRYVFYQGLAFFMEANFKESTPLFARFLKEFPTSTVIESAFYYVAMSNFLSNNYQETLASCGDYLSKFPDGYYAGDMHYRLAFIDFNDKDVDQSDKIIRNLNNFLQEHPDDASNGSMLCLIADTYKRKKSTTDQEATANEDAALAAYIKAASTTCPDDVIQYAMDSATPIMQKRKDWAGVAALHGGFLKDHPDSPLALLSASWVAKMMAREGKGAEAAELLAGVVKTRIANPASEQVEFLLDELVKTLVPKKKAKDIDIEAIDTQLVEILNKVIVGQENTTTAARIYYARARLAQLLKRTDLSDLYMKGIATTNAKGPAGLSPALLAVCGDILIKNGDLDGAEAMFRRLADRYKDAMFADAGPVGLGFIALARKQPEEAYKIFDDALENNPGMSRFKEATLGKLQALMDLNKFEPAEKLALQIVVDKMFRGEIAVKAYLLLAEGCRKQAAQASGAEATELLQKAHVYYQRVYLAYKSLPELCAEAYWQAHETLKALGKNDDANKTLKELSTQPKLKNTQRAKDAEKLLK